MCRQSLELSSSSQTDLKPDPSLQMNPNMQGGTDLPCGTDKVKPSKERKLLPYPQCRTELHSYLHRALPLLKLMRQGFY